MKRNIKILATFLTLALLIGALTTASATESVILDDMKQALIARDFPVQVVENLDEEAIAEIFADTSLEFSGASVILYNEDDHCFSGYNI